MGESEASDSSRPAGVETPRATVVRHSSKAKQKVPMTPRGKVVRGLIALALVGGFGWWWHFQAVVLTVTCSSWTTITCDDTVVGPVLVRGSTPTEGMALVVLSPAQLRELKAALDAMDAQGTGPHPGHSDSHYRIHARWGTHALSEEGRYSLGGMGGVIQALDADATTHVALIQGSPLPSPR